MRAGRRTKRNNPRLQAKRQIDKAGSGIRGWSIKAGQKRVPACLRLARTVMRQRRIHQGKAGAAMQFGKRLARQIDLGFGKRLADAVLLARHQSGAKHRGLMIEFGEIASDMKRVGRCEGGKCQQPACDQPVNRAKRKLRAGDISDADRPGLQRPFGEPRLGPRLLYTSDAADE